MVQKLVLETGAQLHVGSTPSSGTKYLHSTMVMQLTLNQWIQGSNPCGGTKSFIRLMDSLRIY